ncbi:MAG: hypothetical protein MJ230_05605 [bacterium]|nr:hypothetical protein [bacterium]
MGYEINSYPYLRQDSLYNAYRYQFANQNVSNTTPMQYGHYNIQSPIPSFKGRLATQPDTVTFSASNQRQQKKEGMSTGAKLGIGGLVTAGLVIGGLVLAGKYGPKKIAKLYDTKLTQSNLPESITFKTATTKEEALKFTKEILGIKEIKGDITLEGLNFVNEGIVKVSNANKGSLYLPSAINFERASEDYLAAVNQSILSKDFGTLTVNTKYFDEEFIDNFLKKQLYKKDGTQLFSKSKGGRYLPNTMYQKGICPMVSDDVAKILDKYYTDPNSLSITGKRALASTYNHMMNEIGHIGRSPLSFLINNKVAFENNGISIPIDELMHKSTKEQHEFAQKVIHEMTFDKKTPMTIKVGLKKPLDTIYHEMGHLQDWGVNLKKLDLENLEALDGKIDTIGNRWGGLTYDGYKELFEKSPEKFKPKYPDLYEFITDQKIQQTAGSVSNYAQTSIGEFVAEVYAKKLKGTQFDDDVMALYRKYGGPVLP